MTKAWETKLNIALSELLCQMGIASRGEVLYKGRQDVLVYHQGLAVVLEGSYSKQDAEDDAKKRIEQLSADLAIAVHYPSDIPQELRESEIKEKLKHANMLAKPIVPEDFSETLFEKLGKGVAITPDNWLTVDLNGLVELIREVGLFVISEEAVKKTEVAVGDLVDEFVTNLSRHDESASIAQNLHDVLYKLYGFSIGDPVAIKEAVFAQAGLAVLLSAVYYETVRHAYRLDSLSDLSERSSPQQGLEKAVRRILKINYEPVFEATRDMLKAFPSLPRIFGNLLDLASMIASKKTLLRRDFAGKVYHKVVGDWSLKKGLATFFTEVPAAYLLLHLAKPTLSKIGDFACGSGTLLVAAYSAANTNYRLTLLRKGVDRDPQEIEKEFHTTFMQSCHAFDVLEYAAQITALNLAFHSPTTPLHHFSVYSLPFGYRDEDESTSLGSLELVRITPGIWEDGKAMTKVGIHSKERRMLKELQGMEPLDLVAMNPPFTRTTGRGGREGGGLFGFMSVGVAKDRTKQDYEKLRDGISSRLTEIATELLRGGDLDNLLRDKEFQPYTSIWQAGEGVPFLYLADSRLKDKGKLCFVLPRSLLSGSSWFLARTLLAAKYHVEYIVVSYDSVGGHNFSHSTSLSEVLIVAKKVAVHDRKENTGIVMLLKKPATSIEAIALANSLQDKGCELVTSGCASAFLMQVGRAELLEYLDNWGRFAYLPNPTILKHTKDLLCGRLVVGNLTKTIPIKRLNDLVSSIGVDAHRFADTFKIVEERVPGASSMLHGGEEDLRRRMASSPNAYMVPTRDRGAALVQEKASRLLVPDRIWVETAHVISLMCEEPVLSNIFYALRLNSVAKGALEALCLWLNTTWGILTVLANRTETRGGWIRLKQSQWRLLPVLDVTRLSEGRLMKLAEVFHQFKNKELPRIPEQFGTTDKVSQIRIEMDSAFLHALGIKPSEDDLRVLYNEVGSALTQWLGANEPRWSGEGDSIPLRKAPRVKRNRRNQGEAELEI